MSPLGKQLVVGTANFGLPYGVGQSRVKDQEIQKIVSDVLRRNDVFLETSPSYIGAEKKVGQILEGEQFERLIVKVPPSAYTSVENFLNSVEDSLSTLNQEKAYAILLHGTQDAFGENSKYIDRAIDELLDSRTAKHVGISCYQESEILEAVRIFPRMSLFQLPENIVDRRKISSPNLTSLYESGVIFQVRSVFLQGLLLGAPRVVPKNLNEIIRSRMEIEKCARENGISERELCINYAKGIVWASQVVLGAENFEQYKQNIESLQINREDISFHVSQVSEFAADPRMWSELNR